MCCEKATVKRWLFCQVLNDNPLRVFLICLSLGVNYNQNFTIHNTRIIFTHNKIAQQSVREILTDISKCRNENLGGTKISYSTGTIISRKSRLIAMITSKGTTFFFFFCRFEKKGFVVVCLSVDCSTYFRIWFYLPAFHKITWNSLYCIVNVDYRNRKNYGILKKGFVW